MKLLARWTEVLVRAVQIAWRQRMREALAAQWTVHGWAVFGVDGSRLELPRTQSHEAVYSSAASRRPAGETSSLPTLPIESSRQASEHAADVAHAPVLFRHGGALVLADWSHRQQ